jgi:UDP-glucose 4,6-dehydratase
MKILTLGKGFIAEHLPYPIISDRLEISEKYIETILGLYQPDVIINCIGKTGRPNIDWCESHKEETACINTSLPIVLATVCEKKAIHFIHIGSGCIFFGESPNTILIQNGNDTYKQDLGWKENDFANPKSFYSRTKYAADLVLSEMKNVAVLRIRMPISDRNTQRNFINKIRGYNKLIDIPNSVTFMDDLVKMIDWTITKQKTGIYHVVNPQPLSAVRIMNEFKKYIPDHSFEIIDEKALDNLTIAKRSNCILNGYKLRDEGFFMTPSEEALKNCMERYVKNI